MAASTAAALHGFHHAVEVVPRLEGRRGDGRDVPVIGEVEAGHPDTRVVSTPQHVGHLLVHVSEEAVRTHALAAGVQDMFEAVVCQVEAKLFRHRLTRRCLFYVKRTKNTDNPTV